MRVFFIFLSFISLPVFASEEVKRIETYLNSLSTVNAEFIQVAPDGGISEGTFFMQRPGKLRWEYKSPEDVLLIANNDVITYYDKSLDQISHGHTDSNIASFLARKDIKFSGSIDILKVQEEAGLLKVTIRDKKKPEDGKLTMIFDNEPIALRKLEIANNQNEVTQVTFQNPEFGKPLDKELFVFKNPRLFKKK